MIDGLYEQDITIKNLQGSDANEHFAMAQMNTIEFLGPSARPEMAPENEILPTREANPTLCDVTPIEGARPFPAIPGFPSGGGEQLSHRIYREHRDVLSEEATRIARHLKPGDLIFGRGAAPVSQLISRMSGHWSHVAIYLGETSEGSDYDCLEEVEPSGPRPMIIDYRGTVRISRLDEFFVQYPHGAGVARPLEGSISVTQAIEWARSQRLGLIEAAASDGSRCKIEGCGAHVPDDYNMGDLFLCAVLLMRVRAPFLRTLSRLSTKVLKALKAETLADEEKVVKHLDDGRWTCSSFIYQALAQDSARAIQPVFTEGVLNVSGTDVLYMQQPDDEEAGSDLDPDVLSDRLGLSIDFELAPHGQGSSSGTLDPFDGPDQRMVLAPDAVAIFRQIGTLGRRVSKDLTVRDPSKLFKMAVVVGPNDLWPSPSLDRRRFLFADQKEFACRLVAPDERNVNNCRDCALSKIEPTREETK